MSEFKFGTPRTYKNQAGNETTEWPDGLKVVRMIDGRVKIGRQGSQLRGGSKGVQIQQFASGTNPTAHIIAAFDAIESDRPCLTNRQLLPTGGDSSATADARDAPDWVNDSPSQLRR